MEWIYLFVAGLFEIQWAVCLKYAEGFTKLIPSICTIAGMVTGFYFLSLALKQMPLGTVYAIWTGIGTIGTVILGIILFKEPVNPIRVICIALIIAGIAGLKLTNN